MTETCLNLTYTTPDLITTHFNTAELRLYEPLLYDTTLLDGTSRSRVTLSLSDPTTFIRFKACHLALKKWFDHWLTIPVCSYFYMSESMPAQLRYSMVMLSQWALLFSRPRQTSSGTSPRGHSVRRSEIGRAYKSVIGEEDDIDLLSILDVIATRFEAAKVEMSAAQGGVWKNGIWDLAARKIRMKRGRIEKWWTSVESEGEDGEYRTGNEVDGDFGVGAEAGGAFGNSSGTGDNDATVWFDVPFGGGLQDDWLWATDLFGGMDGIVGSAFDFLPVTT